MKKILASLLVASLPLALYACSGDDNTTPGGDAGMDGGGGDTTVPDTGHPDTNRPDTNQPDTNQPDTNQPDTNQPDTNPPPDAGTDTGTDAPANPPPPTLLTQIDRFGRPAINTALNHTFDTTAAKGPAKDAYNADSNPAGWAAAYTAQFAGNLAIFDSLDTVCGNQLLYSAPASATSYNALAGALTGDMQWLNTGSTTCTTYLGVELNALGMANTDCGGRALPYDVIDDTYTVASGSATPVGDGISAVPAKTNGTTFPYLAPAQ